MLLSSDKTIFSDAIAGASNYFGIADAYIEKDFYAISILKELINRNDKFVFKGGTSLSVCQKIINRFSEDIDISYAEETITVGTRKRIKQAFFESIEAVSLEVSNPENIRSRRIFNRYLCPYLSINGNSDTVIVEWATQTPSFPVEEKTAQTIIGKYFDGIGRHDLTEKYDLEEFKVLTITKERTLVDKTFAICDYHMNKKLDRQSRHIYDIYHLLKCVELNQEFIDLFLRVREYRWNLDTCHSAKEGERVSALLYQLVEERTYYDDYIKRTLPLLYDKIPYDECVKSVLEIAKFLERNNL